MKRLLDQFKNSPASYPITIVYIAGVGLAVGVTQGWIDLGIGIAGLTLVAILCILIAILREMRIVHKLVNSQRDELLLRIDVLVDALKEAGVAVPRDPGNGQTFRRRS